MSSVPPMATPDSGEAAYQLQKHSHQPAEHDMLEVAKPRLIQRLTEKAEILFASRPNRQLMAGAYRKAQVLSHIQKAETLRSSLKIGRGTRGTTKRLRTPSLKSVLASDPVKKSSTPAPLRRFSCRAGIPMETVVWKRIGDLELAADIYYPPDGDASGVKRPVALLIHGGGHATFTRNDTPMSHVKMLLQRGLLPISTDYRLSPEATFLEGAVTDCVDALQWARDVLPSLQLGGPAVQVDATKVAVMGWSTGGHLAMMLAATAMAKGVKPPDVVLAYYCATNLEADWWKRPIYPKCIQDSPDEKHEYDLLEGVRDEPIVGYRPKDSRNRLAITLKDERWRLVIHMNWKAQTIPILVEGLPSRRKAIADGVSPESLKMLPMPSADKIQAVSPYAQIVRGNYRTPTFFVHGHCDDLVPWEQSQEAMDALRAQGVEADMAVPDAGHGFDIFLSEDPLGEGRAAVDDSYVFLCRHMGLDGVVSSLDAVSWMSSKDSQTFD